MFFFDFLCWNEFLPTEFFVLYYTGLLLGFSFFFFRGVGVSLVQAISQHVDVSVLVFWIMTRKQCPSGVSFVQSRIFTRSIQKFASLHTAGIKQQEMAYWFAVPSPFPASTQPVSTFSILFLGPCSLGSFVLLLSQLSYVSCFSCIYRQLHTSTKQCPWKLLWPHLALAFVLGGEEFLFWAEATILLALCHKRP